ncbi:MAG: DUF4384 domain-containing protein [Acidobacteriota bacterium]
MPHWTSRGVCVLLLIMTVPMCFPQGQTLSQNGNRIEIRLERKEGQTWRQVDPGLVFLQNDLIRFRVKANFSGYLYVLNHGTSGEYSLLFPSAGAGRENKIDQDIDYAVPATEGSFRITGPAGHEVVYWVVSPVKLSQETVQSEYVPLPPPPKENKVPARLTPRCDDTLFRARGDCIDTSAGPKGVLDDDTLPDNLAGISSLAARELTFTREKDASLVSAPAASDKPVIFEFHLAHR